MRQTLTLLAVTFVLLACTPLNQSTGEVAEASVASAEPARLATAAPAATSEAAPSQLATGHPRLWIRPADVARLRGWATASNPIYAEGLAPLAERAIEDMDAGHVPDEDCGQRAYSEYNSEAYAELFAFMSLIEPQASKRADYAARARTLLMHVISAAAQGSAAEGDRSHRCPGDPDTPVYPPFRDPIFFTEDSDRLRWYGEAFPLTVDWIYGSLSAQDKAAINTVFTRWGQEIIERGYHHPEPIGLVRDPALLADRMQVRWSGNNYFAAHMRNLGMLSLALDPADASPALRGYLNNATGAWLYLFNEMTRSESRGGMLPEGFEYSPQTASYAIQFLLALKTAGQADASLHGPAVLLDNNPFWDDLLTAYLHSLSPATVEHPDGLGPVHQPAWYGDAQRYRLTDFIDAFGALGIYDQLTANATRLNALRWIQTNTAPGGGAGLVERARGADYFRSTILYFMLFDPAAATPTDPRASMATGYLAPGPQRLFSRSDWGEQAAWLTYALPWNAIDHQHAEGNHFEFYRKGEWLTKARIGYANIAEGIASSEFRNSVAIQNARPADRDDDDWRIDLWRRGSQWNLVASGDPGPLLSSFGSDYTYAGGDATNLYNSEGESSTEVVHASRALLWLKPDTIVIYDRADAPAANFKRFWLQLPRVATVSGLRATMATEKGQQLFVTTVLPGNATMTIVDPSTDNVGETVATEEPMTQRLMVQAPAGPKARFLHVLQGADAGAAAQPATIVKSSAGSAFEGVAVGSSLVLFPLEAAQNFTSLSYTAPAASLTHYITGLTPGAGYAVSVAEGGQVSIQPGGTQQADAGGVLVVRLGGAAYSVRMPLVTRG